jgi:hypothetical protein
MQHKSFAGRIVAASQPRRTWRRTDRKQPLREIVRTNDPVLISVIEALFNGAHIPYLVLDQNMSVLEGSIGMLPRRILVDDGSEQEARTLLTDAGLGKELRPQTP